MPTATNRPMHSAQPAASALKTQRREQILCAARALFSREHAEAVAVEDIAAEAGVARSTVYVYFEGRDAILEACVERGRRELLAAVVDEVHEGQDCAGQLMAVLTQTLAEVDRDPGFFRAVHARQFSEARVPRQDLRVVDDPYSGLLEKILRRGIRRGELRKHKVRQSTRVFGQLLFGVLGARALETRPAPASKVAREVVHFFIEGVACR